MGDAVVLGGVGVLDQVVIAGQRQLLLDKVKGDPLRVDGRAGEEGTRVLDGRREVFLVDQLWTKRLDSGTMSRGGAGDDQHGSQERVRV